MFMEVVQTLTPRHESAKKACKHLAKRLKIVETVMVDTQCDADSATDQKNVVQLCAVSSQIQLEQMKVTDNWRSRICTALQQMLEDALLSNHSVQMQIVRFIAISSQILM
jgi:hypothetical protein